MKWDRWILKIDGFLKDGLLEIDVDSFNLRQMCIPFIEWVVRGREGGKERGVF